MMTQQVRFHDALETVEALPLYQQEDLIAIVQRRLAERKRAELSVTPRLSVNIFLDTIQQNRYR